MKLSFLILIFLYLLTLKGTAQEITVTTENSDELNNFAQSIRNIEKFFNVEPQPVYIRLFECSRLIGTLDSGLDVRLYDFYISVKQATVDKPNGEYGFFWVKGHFIDPRNYKFEPQNRTLTFEHGTEDSIKITTLTISSDEIRVE